MNIAPRPISAPAANHQSHAAASVAHSRNGSTQLSHCGQQWAFQISAGSSQNTDAETSPSTAPRAGRAPPSDVNRRTSRNMAAADSASPVRFNPSSGAHSCRVRCNRRA